ncbi:MAG TPA: PAS domain-containing protein [Dermatophilaceae bacterium]
MTKRTQTLEAAWPMIESSLDSLVAIDPDGIITDANEATATVTGILHDVLVGTAFSNCFTDPEKANRMYLLAFEQGTVTDYPLTMCHRDGTRTEVMYNASVYRDAGGNVLGVFAAARDVTKLIQALREVGEEYAREIDQRAKDLETLAELERFQRITVGRELKMIEMKKEIEYLRQFAPDQGAGEPGNRC